MERSGSTPANRRKNEGDRGVTRRRRLVRAFAQLGRKKGPSDLIEFDSDIHATLWQRASVLNEIVDPNPDNYARYPADDDLRTIRSNAELDTWLERQRATTPRKSREDRLAEIAASEPFTDNEVMPDSETGEPAFWQNTPAGLQSFPAVQRRPRHPSYEGADLAFDPNSGLIYEQLPDGSRQDIYQAPSQEWN